MKKSYFQWYSPALGKDMALNVYGHGGKPVIVFPSSGGSYYEYEDFGMVGCIENEIESGKFMLFTVGSVDNESWMNNHISFGERAARHNDYDAYIIQEVVPFVKNMSNRSDILTTGCSLGGYHAMNFYLRHPDVFNAVIALSGCYRLDYFVGDYVDDNIYFNSPILYLPNCNDPWFIDRYRNGQIIACCGQGAWENEMIRDTTELARIFEQKQIPAWCDFWGQDVNHDWDWWRKQLPYFIQYIH